MVRKTFGVSFPANTSAEERENAMSNLLKILDRRETGATFDRVPIQYVVEYYEEEESTLENRGFGLPLGYQATTRAEDGIKSWKNHSGRDAVIRTNLIRDGFLRALERMSRIFGDDPDSTRSN